MIPMLEDVTIVAICHHEWQELEEKHILFPDRTGDLISISKIPHW